MLCFDVVLSHITLKSYKNTLNKMNAETVTAAAAAKSRQLCPTLRSHRQQPTKLCHPWDSSGKNTGMGCHFLLQSITYGLIPKE